MPHPKTSPPSFGFLSIQENAELGYLGGYLLLNASGRPIEFHCTAPIKPTRAQEILYGPTLRPHLYGEQIAMALVNKSKSKPDLLCVDSSAALAVRPLVEMPVLLVEDAPKAEGQIVRIDGAHKPLDHHHLSTSWFQLGHRRVAIAAAYSDDQPRSIERFKHASDHLDLGEPFGRIREALAEAQRGSGK
jgi:hypothetical protein